MVFVSSTSPWLHHNIKSAAGAGKTKLTSRVTDIFRNSCKEYTGLAYFYCILSEDERRSAVSVLRSFVKQVGGRKVDKIHQNLLQAYDERELTGFASASLTFEEATTLVYDIMSAFTQTKLILDALYECSEEDRSDFIKFFDEIVQSLSNVKIFISSRRNVDIEQQMKKEGNIGIETYNNADDIQTFVRVRMKRTKSANASKTSALSPQR